MNEPPQKMPDSAAPRRESGNPTQLPAERREMADLLIAISVVARHLARKIEEYHNCKETDHEQDERSGDDPG